MSAVVQGAAANLPQVHDEAWYAARASRGVQGLKAYDPGHDLVGLRRRFGAAQLVELGSNENPYGPSPAARAAVLDRLHELHRYPDPLGADLKRALAHLHGVSEGELLLGNGSHELLMMVAQVFAGPGEEVVYPRYGFAVFALATQAAGAKAHHLLFAMDDFEGEVRTHPDHDHVNGIRADVYGGESHKI